MEPKSGNGMGQSDWNLCAEYCMPIPSSHFLDSVANYSTTQVDSMTLAYAVHRLSGVATPANAAYSAPELEFQLKSSGAKALFTVR